RRELNYYYYLTQTKRTRSRASEVRKHCFKYLRRKIEKIRFIDLTSHGDRRHVNFLPLLDEKISQKFLTTLPPSKFGGLCVSSVLYKLCTGHFMACAWPLAAPKFLPAHTNSSFLQGFQHCNHNVFFIF